MSIQFNENFVLILKNYYTDLKAKLEDYEAQHSDEYGYGHSKKSVIAAEALLFYEKLYGIMYNTNSYLNDAANSNITLEVKKAIAENTFDQFKEELNKILHINIIYKSYMIKSKDFHLNETTHNLNFATMVKITTLSKRIFKQFVETKMSEDSEIILKNNCEAIPIKLLLKYYINLFEVGLLFSIPQPIFPLTIFCLSHPNYNLCVSIFKEYMKDTKADLFKIGEVMSKLNVFTDIAFCDVDKIFARKGESYVSFNTLVNIADGIFTKYYVNSSKDKVHIITSELNNLRYDTMLDNVFSSISIEVEDEEDLKQEIETFV